MNELEKIDVINSVLIVLGSLCIFFAGYVLNTQFYYSLFLFVAGIVLVVIKAVPTKEEGDEEE